MASIREKSMKVILLVEDPIQTRNVPFLEEILRVAACYRYLEAVQTPPYWRNVGVPMNSAETPLDVHLPGGNVVRQRYLVSDIETHYRRLTRG